MPGPLRRAVAPVLVAVLVSCASAAEQADDVCADAGQKVTALPMIQPRDTRTQILPILDAQLAAAVEAQDKLAVIEPAEVDRPAHDGLVQA